MRRPHRLLEGALHEGTGVLAVDAVTRDGHQVAAAGHGVAKQSQVAVVDVGAVEGDDVVQLPLQGLSHGLDAQNLHKRRTEQLTPRQDQTENKVWNLRPSYSEDLHDVVRGGPDGVHVLLTQDPHQTHAVRLQDPLLQGLELAVLSDDDLLLVVRLRQVHVHLEEEEEEESKA